MEKSLPELNREQVLSMNIEDKTGRYPDELGYFSLIYRTLVFRGLGFYVFIALILMPVLFFGSGPILVRIACTTFGSTFIAAYCLRVFVLCLNLREYRRLTGWVKEISDERVQQLDKRIMRLVGERHFRLSYCSILFRMYTAPFSVFLILTFCFIILLSATTASFQGLTVSDLIIVGVSLILVGIWLIRVVRAMLAFRELKTTIYRRADRDKCD